MAFHSAILKSLIVLVLFGTASGQRSDVPEPQKVTLTATDYAFNPSVVHAAAGRSLQITIVNRSNDTHGLRFVLSYGEVPFPTNVPPGQSASATFDDLGKPGTYRFYCPVDDHDGHGMHGTLIISEEKK
jgi:plastocyanin